MKKTILIGVFAASLLPSVRAADAAPQVGITNLTVTGALDYESQYVFRGKKITNGAFQPTAALSYKISDAVGSVSAFIWNSSPIGRSGTNPAGPNQTDEIDSGVYWDYPTDAIGLASGTLELGFQNYDYPDVGGTADSIAGNHLSGSDEVHVALEYDGTATMKAFNVNPQLWYYHDFILDSNTLVFSISQSYAMDDWIKVTGFTLKPSASFGWTGIHRTFGDQVAQNTPNWRNSYAFWALTVELDYKLSSWCTAYTRLEYSGNNDGTSGGIGGPGSVFGNPQTPGSANSIWIGLGLSFGM